MMTGKCPKCDCTVIVQGLRVLIPGGDREDDLKVVAYRSPTGWLSKGEVRCPLWACVCGACGYTELYCETPTELVRAVAEAQAQTNGGPE